MGSIFSKQAKSAAEAARRRYPTRIPPRGILHQPSSFPTAKNIDNRAAESFAHSNPLASSTKDDAIRLDASDAIYSARLAQLGPVAPSPTAKVPMDAADKQYPASVSLNTLRARKNLTSRAEAEFEGLGREKGKQGREFLDAVTITRAVEMVNKGLDAAEVEKMLGIKKGVVQSLIGGGVIHAI